MVKSCVKPELLMMRIVIKKDLSKRNKKWISKQVIKRRKKKRSKRK